MEFAGTAVTSGSTFGTGISPAAADVLSAQVVVAGGNDDLQWSEGSYRGFFTITMSSTELNATYYAMLNISGSQCHIRSFFMLIFFLKVTLILMLLRVRYST